MAKKETFHQLLVLNHWLLKKFKGGTFESLKNQLSDPALEGIQRDGNTAYFYELTHYLLEMNTLSNAKLEEYDRNILKWWKHITLKRNRQEDIILNMKYFQYLSLLFTEIYLDYYFNKSDELLNELNEELALFNSNRPANELFQPYTLQELNKIAFWNATGSGKTLLLHINIEQYLHYLQKATTKDKYPDKIILLTPNEGLSRQHLRELELSGIPNGVLFDKNKPQLRGTIEIIDINKLGDEMGDKVVAVEAFEGKNLVLVDEGHRGASGGNDSAQWLKRREALCKNGFSFEYSATFGQAVNKGKTITQTELEIKKKKLFLMDGAKNQTEYKAQFPDKNIAEEIHKVQLDMDEWEKARYAAPKEVYAKCVLFDYSYKFFYEDGYGKESLILNLPKDKEKKYRNDYMVAALLAFYQQRYLYIDKNDVAQEFNIENPLWVFVGNTVNDSESDIMTVLQFIHYATIPTNKQHILDVISSLISEKAVLTDAKGRNVFEKRFLPLAGKIPEELYHDILKKVFNASSSQTFRVVKLKGVSGELGLRLGDEPFFGLINVGDSAKVYKNCEEDKQLNVEESDESASLFDSINKKDSKISMLIGSRKFTEGWSSWRVSSMGLLNMGKSEGSQIIQLFGRGVRLKGKSFSLLRTTPSQRPKGSHLHHLETLNIFGIKADYIATFKDYLREEGITPSDEVIEIAFDTQKTLGNKNLKTLKLKDGYKANQINGFKRKEAPCLFDIPDKFKGKIKLPIANLDLYPKIETLQTDANPINNKSNDKFNGKLPLDVMAFFNWDKIYLELLEYKNQKSWYNLRISKERIVEFSKNNSSWYILTIPEKELEIKGFSDIFNLQNIFQRLLELYTEKFYKNLQAVYEDKFYEIATLKDDDSNFISAYHFDVYEDENDSGAVYVQKLLELKRIVETGDVGQISSWNAPHMEAIVFNSHLFYPLMVIESKAKVPLKMRPLTFDAPSEVQFIHDLKRFYDTSPKGKEIFLNKDLYVLRNSSSKDKGIGFTSAGNFYPDFLIWIIEGEKQHLIFVDPKGLRNMDLNDAKFNLYTGIKEVESRLDDSNLTLDAFILSATSYQDFLGKSDKTKEELEDAHILFMEDGRDRYLKIMFEKVLNAEMEMN